MKPCFKNRELIAWLVLGNLENERAIALRRHFETCEGCRRYWSEIATLTAAVKAAEPEPDNEATASFHHRVVAKVRAERPAPTRETSRGFFE